MEKPGTDVLRKYLGVTFPGDESACWEMIREAYREFLGVELKDNPWSCLDLFETIREPEPWAVVIMKNHPIITNHVGLMLDDDRFMHVWDEQVGAVVARLTSAPWTHAGRVAGFTRLKE
jgi:cell wall-associated NlpC family hydrolase